MIREILERACLVPILIAVVLSPSVSDGCLEADFTGDCLVGADDLAVLAEQWLAPAASLDGLEAHWAFDEGSGVVAFDGSGLGRDGELLNMNPGAWATGASGTALTFDGIDDVVEVSGYAGVTGATSRTVTAWIKTTGSGHIVAWGDESPGGKWIVRVDATGALRVSVNSGFIIGFTDLRDGQWHHVAAVLNSDGSPDAKEIKLYVDGVQDPITDFDTQAIQTSSQGQVQIGAFNNGGFFAGAIDEVRIYDRAFSSDELNSTVNLEEFAFLASHWGDQLDAGVVINEIHTDPDLKTEFAEFVELFNATSFALDLSGWSFCDGLNYVFPAGAMLPAGGYLVVAQDLATLAAVFAVPPELIYGPFEGKLQNDGESIELCNAVGIEIDQVDYQLGFPWPTVGDPITTDGTGSSIQLVYPLLDNDLAGSWRSAYPTPGMQNAAVYTANIPPHIRQVEHSPKQPGSGEAATITCKVTDPDGVNYVNLEYQVVEPGNYIRYQYANRNNNRINDPAYETGWVSIAMNDSGSGGDSIAGDDIYTVEIPGSVQVHRRLIRYRIKVKDNTGLGELKVPYSDDPQPNFAYFVYDGVPGWTGADQPGATSPVVYSAEVMNSLPTYHLIAKEADVLECQYVYVNPYGTKAGWYHWSGTLVYDGVVYDNVWYRNRGWWSAYEWGKNKWKFDFNRGHYFQARDNYGNKYKEKWDKMNYSACIMPQCCTSRRGEQGMFEAITYKLFDLTGVPASNTNWVHYRIIDDAVEAPANQYEGDFWGMYMAIEQPDGRFLDEHGLPDGNLYKMAGYPPGENWTSRNNQGPTQAADMSDVWSFINDYHSYPSQTWWENNAKLDVYYSYRTVVDAVHHYDLPDTWNSLYYHNPETSQWWMIPWDVDLSWDCCIYANDTEQYKQVFSFSESNIKFKNRLREIRDLLINNDQGWQLIDEYAAIISDADLTQSFAAADRAMWDYHSRNNHPGKFYQNPSGDFSDMVQYMKDFINTGGWGGNNLDSIENDSAIPDTPVVVGTGNETFPINDLTFETTAFSDPQGAGTFAAMKWRIGEITDETNPSYNPSAPKIYEITSVWESEKITQFQNNIIIPASQVKPGHTYRVRCRMQDNTGRWSHWSAPIEFETTPPLSNPILDDLRLTELMYRPLGGSDYEYIELRNTGDDLLDLTHVVFTEGISFAFAGSNVTSLSPGEYVLVVHNQAAFESRYGTGLSDRIAGAYPTTKLSNGGEPLTLIDAEQGTIAAFEYNDARGWPQSADGGGHALVPLPSALAAQAEGSLNYGGNWQAGAFIHGSPGQADPTPPPAVMLNELMAHTDFNDPIYPDHDSNDWIELYNPTDTAINLKDWHLSDDIAEPAKWALPALDLAAGQRISFDEVNDFHNPLTTGFGLNKAGETLFLSYLPGTVDDRIADVVRFKGQDSAVSLGRYPDGAVDWLAMPPTRDNANATPIEHLVIDEIMYHPPLLQGEYLELYNPTASPIILETSMGPWRLDGAVAYRFPAGLSLAPDARLLVVGFDPAANATALATFQSDYSTGPLTAGLDIVGPWSGNLSNGGERIAVEMPQAPDQPGDSISWIIADEVIYADQSPWPAAPNGQGDGLQRLLATPSAAGVNPSNWTAAAPTPGM